jgi:Lrp/AsnC family transcriptional regulator, regulator for asnA, asnC and gidA
MIENLSHIEEVLEVHEMHSRFDLFVKVRAKDLNHTRDIIENKICILPYIVETQLMTVLKTSKEEQMASLNNPLAKNDDAKNGEYKKEQMMYDISGTADI